MRFGLYNYDNKFDFVTPRIATGGSIWSAEDIRALRLRGITHIATMAIELEDRVKSIAHHMPVLLNGVHDDLQRKPVSWFARTIDFSLDALSDPRSKIYIHCGAGINRGPSGAYSVMRAQGMKPDEAWDAIMKARPIAAIIYADDADEALYRLGYDTERQRLSGFRGRERFRWMREDEDVEEAAIGRA